MKMNKAMLSEFVIIYAIALCVPEDFSLVIPIPRRPR